MRSNLTALVILFFAVASAYSARLQPESAYQAYFANKIGGKTEVVAGDGTRCDILTGTTAIEVDFADKWGEAIGQSLNYGFQFNRKAGIVLILESQADYKYFLRVNSIIEHYKLPIQVWTIDAYKGEGLASAPAATSSTTTPKVPVTPISAESYWISSSGKTHRSGCRYFGTGKGRSSSRPSGNNCKICGGAGR